MFEQTKKRLLDLVGIGVSTSICRCLFNFNVVKVLQVIITNSLVND